MDEFLNVCVFKIKLCVFIENGAKVQFPDVIVFGWFYFPHEKNTKMIQALEQSKGI